MDKYVQINKIIAQKRLRKLYAMKKSGEYDFFGKLEEGIEKLKAQCRLPENNTINKKIMRENEIIDKYLGEIDGEPTPF
jgi:hypothetical protein